MSIHTSRGRVWGFLFAFQAHWCLSHRTKQAVVPFRDSKLTRVFQGFFTGRGRSCMIVNINQCASTYDETLHVAKFSAIASQVRNTHQDHGMVRVAWVSPASVGLGPFPTQGEGACLYLVPMLLQWLLLPDCAKLKWLTGCREGLAVFKDYTTSRLCRLIMVVFSPSACSGTSHKAGTSILEIHHQRTQQANQPGSRGRARGRCGIRRRH